MFTDGMSRLAVAVSVAVALSLAIFLTILVLFLADLFCAHLRGRRLRDAASRPKLGLRALSPTRTDDGSVATTTSTAAREALVSTPPFYYAHGVMHAPNLKDLLLTIPKLEAAVWRWSPARRSSSTSSSERSDRFVCISNPVYERGGQMAAATGGDTPPFETPGASPSPSPFGITEEDEEEGEFSPPLSAMRKLPPLGVMACPPPALSFIDGGPSLTVTDTNRASSSSCMLQCSERGVLVS